MKIKNINVGILCASAVVAITSIMVFLFSPETSLEAKVPATSLYPINENGQTYGKIIYLEQEKNLI